MGFTAWAVALLAGVVTGGMTCLALVVRRRRVVLAGLAASFAAALTLGACGAIWFGTRRPDALIAAGFIAAAAAVGGYALGAALLLDVFRSREHLPIIRTIAARTQRLGVIVLADAEPHDYDPRAVTAVLKRYQTVGAPLPPELAKPLVYAAERSRYVRLGSSPARETIGAIAGSLGVELDRRGVPADVVAAFCDGESLPAAVSHLAATGHTRLVIAPLSVARFLPLSEAIEALDPHRPARSGVQIEVADSLWGASGLVGLLSKRIVDALESRESDGGVCLVEPGEPEAVHAVDRDAVEHATYFAERLRADLIASGIHPERIRRAWLQWEEPDVYDAARHLSAVGAQRIVFVPLTFPAEGTQTLIDLRYAAEQASSDAAVATVVLGAWGNDPSLVSALADQAIAASAKLAGS